MLPCLADKEASDKHIEKENQQQVDGKRETPETVQDKKGVDCNRACLPTKVAKNDEIPKAISLVDSQHCGGAQNAGNISERGKRNTRREMHKV